MEITQRNSSFANLRRFIRQRVPVERCELCSAGLATNHQHLIEPASRKLLCACDACSILFSNEESKYRRVPKDVRSMPNFQLSEAQWESLLIPINMAFFFHSSPANRIVALYPSPAGATESLLTLGTWEEIAEQNPALHELRPDVEALLVNRVRSARQTGPAEYFIAPIDECYKLTGLIRARWRGLSGGAEVWEEIGRFFAELKERAIVVKEAPRA
ncbi:MAG: hypothetical protein JST85_26975 [Acidobacteria bacterium]|nr:hypothetical protein [Acidobacteriota bacterium]